MLCRILAPFLLLSCCCLWEKTTFEPDARQYIERAMWTASNLRVKQNLISQRDFEIYWQNYLDSPILPAGTLVRFTEITDTWALFADNQGNRYTFYWNGTGKSRFREEASKYFTVSDPSFRWESMTPEEMQSIKIGEVKRGMSKELVLICWGFPLHSSNPLKEEVWYYFESLDKKCAVYFENGIVAEIIR